MVLLAHEIFTVGDSRKFESHQIRKNAFIPGVAYAMDFELCANVLGAVSTAIPSMTHNLKALAIDPISNVTSRDTI